MHVILGVYTIFGYTFVYSKAHTQNTITVLQKASKHTVKILMINIALYTEVSCGEGNREED